MKQDKGEKIKKIVEDLQKKTPQKAKNPMLVQKEIKKELTKEDKVDKKEEKKDPKKEKISSIVSKVKELLNK